MVPDDSLPRLLFVEDNAVQQKIIALLGNRIGFEPRIVDNCAAALHLLEAGEEFVVICMDISLSDGFDGFECSRRIRLLQSNRQERKHVPIIALTARAMPDDKARCLQSGMDDYLSKPFTIEELSDMLHKWIK